MAGCNLQRGKWARRIVSLMAGSKSNRECWGLYPLALYVDCSKFIRTFYSKLQQSRTGPAYLLSRLFGPEIDST
jgi:hypothetical protein